MSRRLGAISVTVAETEEQAQRLWQARKAISPALFKLAPHKINEDIVVPRSRVPDLVAKIDELLENTVSVSPRRPIFVKRSAVRRCR